MLLCVTSVRAQICEGSLGDPVINIDFGRGNTNFGPSLGASTNYNFVTLRSPNGEGDYTIAKSTSNLNLGWYTFSNHTPDDINGYMMIVNAATSPGIFYESATPIDLCPNTTYEFAAWVYNMLRNANGIRPNITFFILSTDNEVLGTYNTGDLPNADPQWRQYGLQFRTTAAAQVKIRMVNNGKGGVGNDIALDDITFRACGPVIKGSIGNTNNITENICEQSNLSLKLSVEVEGNPSLSYQWQKDEGNGWVDLPGETTSSTTAVFVNAVPGQYYYRVLVGDPLNFGSVGCRTASPTLTINVNRYPDPKAISNKACVGDPIMLDVVDAPGIYEWTNPQGVVISTEKSPVIPNATLGMAGVYNVKVNSLGCIVNASVTVEVVNPPVAQVNKSEVEICQGTTTQLVASGGTSYTWRPTLGLTATDIPNPIAFPEKTTLYTVTISNGFCSRTAQVNVIVIGIPKADAGADKKILLGNSVQLEGAVTGDEVNYYWTPETGLDDPRKLNPIASPTVSTTYTLNAVSGLGCVTSTDEAFVLVYEKVLVSSSFTPNGDGINDFWKITAIDTYSKPRVRIVNRYGELIYESTDYYNKPWTGKQNGKDVPVGTYYYLIYLNPEDKPLSGAVTVIR